MTMTLKQEKLSQIPQVDRLLGSPPILDILAQYPRPIVTDVVREELERIRQSILNNGDESFKTEPFIEKIQVQIQKRLQPDLRRSINAAGIVLHTNMGRAPLSDVAKEALREVAENYSNLEIDLDSGKRGSRYAHVENLLCELTGAEAAMVVNNNAAATLLVLNSLAKDKECLLSRGELITIGDSFRLPEVMRQGGAKLVEVGSTNQTYVSDFEQAITEETALVMKVHTSNYRIIGFFSEVTLQELVQLGHEKGLTVYHDVGSGALIDLSKYGLPKEPVIQESIAAGADVVSFSGDKLIGGPQAGIIVGKKDLIGKMKTNHLTRALRAGKLTYAALEATLRLFLDKETLSENHAVLHMLTRKIGDLEVKARKIVTDIGPTNLDLKIEDGLSEIGGGSLAAESLPTKLVTISSPQFSPDVLAGKLRKNRPPVITRIQNNRVVLDMRTVREDEVDLIVLALQSI